jgi:hypothetical protein
MIQGWRQKRSFDRFFTNYSNLLIKGDFRAAYETAGPEFRNAVTFETFLQQHKLLAIEKGELISIRQGQTIVEGKVDPPSVVAITTATLRFSKGPVDVTYEFQSDGSAWHLYGFHRDN